MHVQVNADAVPLALGLACRHSHLGSNLQAVCSLLAVSKAVQQAVLDACSGPDNSQLHLTFDADAATAAAHGVTTPLQYLQRLSHQAQWLTRYGRLAKQLSIYRTTATSKDLSHGLNGADEAVMCLAVKPPLQLQMLQLAPIGPLRNPAAVLQQVDAAYLTKLTVGPRWPRCGAAASSG
jgi:hypothetical protein